MPRLVPSTHRNFRTRTKGYAIDSLVDMSNQPISTFERPPIDRWLDQADDYARREPVKAVACAFSAGFLVNLLPIGTIVGALAAIVFAMLRPFLLFLGLLKACELWKTRS
jgi:hypothetical protein